MSQRVRLESLSWFIEIELMAQNTNYLRYNCFYFVQEKHDYPFTYVYNEELKTVLVLNGNSVVQFLRERKNHPDDGWIIDKYRSQSCSDTLQLPEASKNLVINHVSPNGKYILVCAPIPLKKIKGKLKVRFCKSAPTFHQSRCS